LLVNALPESIPEVKMKISRSLIVLLGLFAVLLPVWSIAQTATSGAILGTIVDPSGAIVPAAQVQLVNADTNTKLATQANSSGAYSFPTVAPGKYSITVTAPGFKTSTVAGVSVQVNSDSTVNFSLLLGEASQVVDVDGSSAQVQLQTTDATVGDVIGAEAIAQLPTRLRQAQELMLLQPGTTPASGADSGGSIAGAVNDQTTFTFDGIDITDNMTNSTTDTDHGARPTLMVSVEAVDEFRVGVSNNNSTFNKGAGGQVTLIGKSGSNKFHGGLFFYAQNSAFNANTWDNNHLNLKKPHVEDNRYGGYIGGPIFRDKTFFFAEYEARRYPETFQVSAIVPTPTLAQGILQFKDGAGNANQYALATSNLCGAAGAAACDPRHLGISPTMAAMMAAEPAGNNPGLTGTDGLNTTGFTANTKSPLTDDFGTFRLDHTLNAKWHLNGSFSYSRDLAYNSAPIVLDIRNPSNVINSDELPNWTNAFIFGATGQLTANLTENFHFGDVRNRNGALRPQLSAIAQELAFPGTSIPNAGYVAVSPNIFTAPITMSNTVRTQSNNDVTIEFGDDLAWTKHNHIIQGGVNIERLNLYHVHTGKVGGAVNSLNATETADSSYLNIPAADRPKTCASATSTGCLPASSATSWDNLYASTLGLMNDDNAFVVRDQNAAAEPIGNALVMNTHAYYSSFYVQDTWRVIPSLTLTYGLSYSWQTPFNFANQAESLLVDAATLKPISAKDYLKQRLTSAEAGTIYNPLLAFQPVAKSGRGSVYNTDYGNIAPRIAAAWSPSFEDGFLGKVFGVQKTVLRGGFGLYYDRLNGEVGVVDPGLTAGPSSTVSTGLVSCAASGTPGVGCNANSTDPGLSDFRIGVDGSIPLPTYAATLANPYVPADGYGELVSSGIDINYKAPRVFSSNLTVQRDLGHGTVLELAWTGRYGRRLYGNAELNASPYMFRDSASGQSFAQAYDAVANALRNGQPVQTQAWFENQLPNIGSTHGYPSTTAYLAAVQAANFVSGNVANIFDATSTSALGLNFLRKSLGLQAYDETQVNDLSVATNIGWSNYNALFATLKHTGRSLTIDVNYTLSKSLDTNQGVANDSTNLGNPLNPQVDYGPSKFDRRNTLNAIFVYNSPKSYSMFSKPVNTAIAGWYVSGIVTAVSGLPLYVTEGTQVFGGGQRSTYSTPAVPLVPVSQIHTGVHYNVPGSNGIGTSSGSSGINLFSNPAAVHSDFGYVQLSDNRDGFGNPLRGLPFINTDASVGKVFPIRDRAKLKISADFFNLFNNVTFANPTMPLVGSTTSTFGVITNTSVPANRQASSRWIMLGGRIEF
jgi:hypothetical protein